MSEITDSVLNSQKKLLGIDTAYKVFDDDLIIHINTIFGTLHQLGVGPQDQFTIDSELDTWSGFTTNNKIMQEVKTYMYLSLRLLFDPPANSFVYSGMKQQLDEYTWRLTVKADELKENTGND